MRKATWDRTPTKGQSRKGAKYEFKKTEARTGRGVNKENTLPWEGKAAHTVVHMGENMRSILEAYCGMKERSLSGVVRQALREFMSREQIVPVDPE